MWPRTFSSSASTDLSTLCDRLGSVPHHSAHSSGSCTCSSGIGLVNPYRWTYSKLTSPLQFLLWFLPDLAVVVLLEALRQLMFEPKERLLGLQGSGLRVSLVPFLNNGLVANRRDSQQSPLSFSEWVGMTTTRLVTTFYNLPSCSSLGWKFLSTSSLKSSGSRE